MIGHRSRQHKENAPFRLKEKSKNGKIRYKENAPFRLKEKSKNGKIRFSLVGMREREICFLDDGDRGKFYVIPASY